MKQGIFALNAVAFAYVMASVPAKAEISGDSAEIETITILGKSNVKDAEIAGVNVKELPINIHVVGQDEMERIRFVDANEFLDRIPGETQVRNLRIPDGGKGYTIPMVDGIPLENPYEGATQRLDRINTFDISQVQVIKGPSSALYGNNAFGGVVNVITKDAPKEQTAQVLVEAGNFGRSRLGVSTGGTASSVGYFIDVNSRRLDGMREESKNDRDQASAKLIFNINNDLRIITRAEYLDEQMIVRGDLTEDQIKEDKHQAGSLSSSEDLQQSTLAVKFEQNFTSGVAELSLVRREKDTIGASRFRGPQDENDLGYSLKASYRHEFNNFHLLGGYELYDGEQDTKRYGRDDINLQGTFTKFQNELNIDAYFMQYHHELTADLTLTAGVRYEDIELSSSLYNDNASFSDLAPKVGISYQVDDNHLFWASVSEGFYAPDLSDLYDPEEGNPNLKPEEMTNVEIGIRGQFGHWYYDTSIYDSEIENYLVTQELINDQGHEYEQVTNAGLVSLKGVETVIEFAPEDSRWRLGFTHTFNRNTYDSFVQSTPGASDDLSGKVMRRAPKHHFNGRLAWAATDNFTIEFEADAYSHYYADHANSDESKFTRDPRYHVRMDYVYYDWKFWLHGLNLTDTIEDRATYSRGKMKYRTVDGRTFYMGATYQF